jgi:hypothetical protein
MIFVFVPLPPYSNKRWYEPKTQLVTESKPKTQFFYRL